MNNKDPQSTIHDHPGHFFDVTLATTTTAAPCPGEFVAAFQASQALIPAVCDLPGAHCFNYGVFIGVYDCFPMAILRPCESCEYSIWSIWSYNGNF